MTMLWIIIISVSIYGWLVVYSLYLELSDLTKLEDLAHLRVRIKLKIFNRSKITEKLCHVLDGNDAIIKRICHAIASRITPHNPAQHRLNDASVINSLTCTVRQFNVHN